MENHSSGTGHQGSRVLKRVWMGGVGWGGVGGTIVSCQLNFRPFVSRQLNDY